ncbi:hypothetical protein OAF34_01700 [Pirellulaceae bacterium]|nr:hypothetical protein [Pirellulaceae bacterium]
MITKTIDHCGHWAKKFGNEIMDLVGNLSYERWLMLSVLAVIIGLSFLRSNR